MTVAVHYLLISLFISIDEWNKFARHLFIRPVGISEFFGQHSLLDLDPDKENRDQG